MVCMSSLSGAMQSPWVCKRRSRHVDAAAEDICNPCEEDEEEDEDEEAAPPPPPLQPAHPSYYYRAAIPVPNRIVYMHTVRRDGYYVKPPARYAVVM